MEKVKLEYPTALTNQVWQVKKGIGAGSTGIGEVLVALEREFKRSPFDDGVDPDDLVSLDPLLTIVALEGVKEGRLAKPLLAAIGVTNKKFLEVEKELKPKLTARKAYLYVGEMKKALASFKEQVEGFPAEVCSKVHTQFINLRDHDRKYEGFQEVSEEAESHLETFGIIRNEVRSAETIRDFRIAMTRHRTGAAAQELAALWHVVPKLLPTLLAKLNSPIREEGSATRQLEGLKWLCGVATLHDNLLEIKLEELRVAFCKRNPNATDAAVVAAFGKAFLDDLGKAEKVLDAMVKAREEADDAARKIARLGRED